MKLNELTNKLREGATLCLVRYLSTVPKNSEWEGKPRASLRHYFLDSRNIPVTLNEYLPDGSDAMKAEIVYKPNQEYAIDVSTRRVEKGNVSLTGKVLLVTS